MFLTSKCCIIYIHDCFPNVPIYYFNSYQHKTDDELLIIIIYDAS
jgi:hypothetical protein